MTPTEVLSIEMRENDAEAATVRDYLKALVLRVWDEGEGFSGKRPFGNSGWQCDMPQALVRAGAVKGKLDDDGYLDDWDEPEADKLIRAAIAAL